MTVPDSSFLFSFYGLDGHSAQAVAMARSLDEPLTLTALHRFEFENAQRLAVFRGLVMREDANRRLAALDADIAAGSVVLAPHEPASLVEAARKLSARFTETLGQRAMDILLVAAAVELGATAFLTFDARQQKLAKAVGLRVEIN